MTDELLSKQMRDQCPTGHSDQMSTWADEVAAIEAELAACLKARLDVMAGSDRRQAKAEAELAHAKVLLNGTETMRNDVTHDLNAAQAELASVREAYAATAQNLTDTTGRYAGLQNAVREAEVAIDEAGDERDKMDMAAGETWHALEILREKTAPHLGGSRGPTMEPYLCRLCWVGFPLRAGLVEHKCAAAKPLPAEDVE